MPCTREQALRHAQKPVAFGVIIIIGGAIFSALETDRHLRERDQLHEFMLEMNSTLSPARYDQLVGYLGLTQLELKRLDHVARGLDASSFGQDWDFPGACFFCFTVATTIGYGTYAPKTSSGKLFLILYALIAIPVCFAAFTGAIQALLARIVKLLTRKSPEARVEQAFSMLDRDRNRRLTRNEALAALKLLGYGGAAGDESELTRRFGKVFDECSDGRGSVDLASFVKLLQSIAPDAMEKLEGMVTKGHVVAVAVVLFLAMNMATALTFWLTRHGEGWTFLDSLYFSFVTFTTIGLGDLSFEPHPGWQAFIFVVVCFCGLGVTVAVIQAGYDPELDMMATLRGAMPSTMDRVHERRTRALTRMRDRTSALLSRTTEPITVQHDTVTCACEMSTKTGAPPV